MGMVDAEQTARIIESVGSVVNSQPVSADTHWWQIFAVVGATVASLLTAWAGYVAIKRKAK